MSENTILNHHAGDHFAAYHGDTVDVARHLPDESVGLSVFSPPFASLFTYSASERDLGNCKSYEEFWQHYDFLIRETFRVMQSGRLVAIHCMLLPTSKQHDGFIGLRDFRGDIIRAYAKHGFIQHSEVCIWKDPVTAMQRTKALGLLYKQLRKDSAMSRQGIPDYVVVMRKPGENKQPVAHTPEDFPVGQWQRWASPVWAVARGVDSEGFAIVEEDIDQSDTLNARSAREDEDERHLCPLQLEVIRRCVGLWSNEGDTVWSPFMGIGSEGVVSVEMGRNFVGAELKRSYYEQAVRNLDAVETKGKRQFDLFDQLKGA